MIKKPLVVTIDRISAYNNWGTYSFLLGEPRIKLVKVGVAQESFFNPNLSHNALDYNWKVEDFKQGVESLLKSTKPTVLVFDDLAFRIQYIFNRVKGENKNLREKFSGGADYSDNTIVDLLRLLSEENKVFAATPKIIHTTNRQIEVLAYKANIETAGTPKTLYDTVMKYCAIA